MARFIGTISLLLTMALIAAAPVWAADQMQLTFNGIIHGDEFAGATVGEAVQVGPLGPNDDTGTPFEWGTLSAYSAPAYMPQLTAGDIDKYGWAFEGTVESIDTTDNIITYTGAFYICAPGYGFDTVSECIESGVMTASADYDASWATATVTGTIVATEGTVQPAGWPSEVDFSLANPGTLAGTFSSATNELSATLSGTVPNPTNLYVDDSFSGSTGTHVTADKIIGYNAFTTINAALTAADSGDTINVAAGTYTEALNVDKSVSIIGSGASTVTIDAAGLSSGFGSPVSAIYVTADGAYLEGFTVQGTRASGTINRGIKVLADNVVLKDITVKDMWRVGIDVINSDNIRLEDITATNNGGAGIFAKNINGLVLRNIHTIDNAWGGVALASDGFYLPEVLDNVVIEGTNSFDEETAGNAGMYVEVERSGAEPTYGATGSFDVMLQSQDFAYALKGPQDDGATRIRFYRTLEQAQTAAQTAMSSPTGPGHFLDSGRYVENTAGTQLYVFPGMSIQTAINAADTGDTINVAAGTYAEALDVSKSVHIVGASEATTIIDVATLSSGYGSPVSAIFVSANSVELKQFTVTSSTPNSAINRGIKVLATDVTLQSITVQNMYRVGIDVINSNDITLIDVQALNNGGAGLFLKNVNGLQLTDITTSGNAWGGIALNSDGAYDPHITTGVVFSGTNSFGEPIQLYLEVERCGTPMTYGTSGTVDVKVQASDFTNVLNGPQDDAPYNGCNATRTVFFKTYEQAVSLAEVPTTIGHFLVEGRYILKVDGSMPDATEATISFAGFDNIQVGVLHTVSITAIAADPWSVPPTMPLRYKATLLREGVGVSNVEIDYGSGVFSTDTNGIAYFGPADGFTVDQTGGALRTGITTDLAAALAQSGSYTLQVELLDWTNPSAPRMLATNTQAFTVSAPAPEAPSVEVTILDAYPKNNHYVFVCSATGMAPTAYDWNFGDGESLTDVDTNNVYHIFETSGTYTVSCSATEGDTTLVDWETVTVNVPPSIDAHVKAGFPVDNSYTLVCDTPGMTPTAYDWEIRHIESGVREYLQYDIANKEISHDFQRVGEYMVVCSATEGANTLIDAFTVTNTVAGTPTSGIGTPIPGTSATVVVTNTSTTVVVPQGANQDLRIEIPANVAEASVDLSALLIADTTQTAALLPIATVFDSDATTGVEVNIPAGTTVYSSTAWDGVLDLPHITTTTATLPSGSTIGSAIEVGSSVPITFDKAIRIRFANRANERVAFVRNGVTTEITTACANDVQTSMDIALAPGADCKIAVGNDMVVWTKHFTEFVTYTTPAPRRSSGGGGGFFERYQETPAPEQKSETAPAVPLEEPRTPAQGAETPAAQPTPEQRPVGTPRENPSALTGRVTGDSEDSSIPQWVKAAALISVLGIAVVAVVVRFRKH